MMFLPRPPQRRILVEILLFAFRYLLAIDPCDSCASFTGRTVTRIVASSDTINARKLRVTIVNQSFFVGLPKMEKISNLSA